MIKTTAVTLSILVAIDYMMTGGAYTHIAKQIFDSFMHHSY